MKPEEPLGGINFLEYKFRAYTGQAHMLAHMKYVNIDILRK